MTAKPLALNVVAWVWVALVAGGCAPSGQGVSVAREPIKQVVGQHLEARYPGRGASEWSSRKSRGFPYTKHELELLSTPELLRVKPNTRFYITRIRTDQYEFPEVPTLVSVEGQAPPYKVRDMPSPVYENDSADFLQQFFGIEAGNNGRAALARAIAELVRSTVYRGELKHGRFEGDTYRLELWWYAGRFRDLLFKFNTTGTLQAISL